MKTPPPTTTPSALSSTSDLSVGQSLVGLGRRIANQRDVHVD
jgi:hypothetical protein